MQARMPLQWDGKITGPSPEAPPSGVNRTLHPNELLWYRRLVELPKLSLQRDLFLHFEAVDGCALLRQRTACRNTYRRILPFSFDITDFLGMSKKRRYRFVYDPSDAGLRCAASKRSRVAIFGTAQSGI